MKTPSTPSVLFRLCDDALIVANTGEPFTREGVIAICHLHLSSKDKDTLFQERVFIKENRRLIADIAGRMIESYRPNSNRIIEDARGEIGLNKEYQGRLLWELLQNVDDAAVAADPGQAARDGLQPIGAKGLGFKSVLEISESPEIYSGDFRFLFSRERTLDRLQGILKDGNNTVPIFRIPHECEPGKDCRDLLQSGRSTVIRLPFRAGKEKETRDKLAEKLGSLSETCLLLCQKLERIDIEIQGQSPRVLEIDRDGVFGFHCEKATFTLAKNSHQTQWRRWCKEWTPRNDRPRSVAVFLPLENGKATQCDKEQRLHVFFPADREKISAKALIHADYELETNREGLQKEQPYGDEIRDEVCNLVARVLKEIDPAVALRAFGSVAANGEDGNETSKLNAAIAKTVRETAFVPVIGGDFVNFVKIEEVRLWKHGIGKVLHPEKVGDQKLLAPELEKDGEICKIIRELSPHYNIMNGIVAHAEILQNCKNDSLEECLEAAKIAVEIRRNAPPHNAWQVDELLKKAPFWWTGETAGRALTGGLRLLQKQPDEWPDFIKCDELDPIFLEKLQTPAADANKTPAASISESLSKGGRGDLWPLGSSNYFKDILLPFCQGESVRWQDIGGKILWWVSKWGNKSKMPDEAKQAVCFPTDEGWLVANDCYAGQAWGGPACFDSLFKGKVVLPLENWGLPPDAMQDQEKWWSIMKQLGVSKTPKIRHESIAYLRKYGGRFGLGQRTINEFEGWIRPPNANYIYDEATFTDFVEHFPESLGESPPEIFRAAKEIFDSKPKTEGSYLKKYGRRAEKISTESLAMFQLRKTAWLPCTSAYLAPEGDQCAHPQEVFMPGKGLGIFPEVARDHWDQFASTLEEFVRKETPSPEDKWWREKAQQLAEKVGSEKDEHRLLWKVSGAKGDIAEAVARFYSKFHHSLRDMGQVPYIHATDAGEEFIKFAPREETRWADKPYHEDFDVRKALIKRYKIFPFFLGEGKVFDIDSLSDSIDEEAETGEAASKTEEMCDHYESRKGMLSLVAGKSQELPAGECIKAFASLRLILRDRQSDDQVICPKVDYHWRDDELLVNASDNKWFALAAGIAKKLESPKNAEIFEFLLSDKPAGCIKRLQQRGFSEAQIKDAENETTEQMEPLITNDDSGGGEQTARTFAVEKDEPTRAPVASDQSSVPSPVCGERGAAVFEPSVAHPDKTTAAPAASGQSSGDRISRPARSGGTSGGGDPEIKKEVEKAAMQAATRHYKSRGYEVESVEAEKIGWDLEAVKGGEKLRVEVKGISGERISVSLTHNEFKATKQHRPDYRLAVFRNIPNNHRCAIYKQRDDGDQWQWVEGDNTAAKQLKTKNKADIMQD